MKLSTKGRYGLRAVLDIALNQDEGPVTIHSISERQGISERYLEQLLITLRKNGIIRSIRGFQGGYVLNRETKDISVGDVVRALEGPISPVECVEEGRSGVCNRIDICVTRNIWEELRKAMNQVLDSYSLEDLVRMFKEKNCNKNKEDINNNIDHINNNFDININKKIDLIID
ncbi:MAG: Rrf2 family transcriptional regulator [Peptococcaceae bacterium]|nr:Rrf2 family transcriptional regulator [Peptococcaceae bacterium]